jgi:N-acylglucosamine 2-epimerase
MDEKVLIRDAGTLAGLYRKELLGNVIPFWLENSFDKEFGGYFSCLDRNGRVYDTDKFMWLQGRQVWMFSALYNRVEKREEWLDAALLGAGFMEKHGTDREGNWYFSLDRSGNPLVQPYNIFSDCFAAMAFGQLYRAAGVQRYADLALATFRNIISRMDNPKGKYNKAYPGTRALRNFSLPMILCNLALEIENLLDPEEVAGLTSDMIHQVMEVFYQPKRGIILENVSPDGSFDDCFEGRLVNPGHGIEAMWFIMDAALRSNDVRLARKAAGIVIDTLEYGWDSKYGGIYYFLDIKGHPPQQLEWDQKLWWVHIESLISLLRGYLITGDPRCAEWFYRVHDYVWKRFPDPAGGEWFGYLNRRGEVLLPLKGGKWKGCFHVPRGLLECWHTLEKIAALMKDDLSVDQ